MNFIEIERVKLNVEILQRRTVSKVGFCFALRSSEATANIGATATRRSTNMNPELIPKTLLLILKLKSVYFARCAGAGLIKIT